MSHNDRIKIAVAASLVAATAALGWNLHAQGPAPAQAAAPSIAPTNDLPNPYETIENYFKLPAGRQFGATSSIEIDKDGKTIWVAERCGANSACLANKVDPVLHFDEKGNLITSFGAGMIVAPHGIFVDKDDNVWVTDYQDDVNGGRATRPDPAAAAARGAARGAAGADAAGARGAGAAGGGRGAAADGRGAAAGADPAAGGGRRGGGAGAPAAGAPPAAGGGGGGQGRGAPVIPNPNATMGHQVFKFDKTGKLLMTIGRKGGAKPPEECCYQPNDVLVAPNGDIYVAQGHGTAGVNYIFKFDKTGKLLSTMGKDGAGPGEFNQPHALAMDSKGRLFVGDRGNNRVQVFDKDGKFVADWPQFSRPSGIYIDKKDNLYSADSESGSVNPAHGAWKRGLRIGSAKDGKVLYFIPDPRPDATGTSAAEGVAADAAGNLYGAEVGPMKVQKYVKKK